MGSQEQFPGPGFLGMGCFSALPVTRHSSRPLIGSGWPLQGRPRPFCLPSLLSLAQLSETLDIVHKSNGNLTLQKQSFQERVLLEHPVNGTRARGCADCSGELSPV